MIYVIQCGEFHKIGYTSGRRVEPRLKALQTASPHKLTLVDVWPGDEKEEHAMHERFADRRVRGEWFRLLHSDLMWIGGIAHMRRALYGYPVDFSGQEYVAQP
jgi:hypothetical protein